MAAQMALPVDCQPNGKAPLAVTGPASPPRSRATEPLSMTPVRVSEVPDWVHRITLLGVFMVAGVTAVGSFEHIREFGLSVGEGWRASLAPFGVDGLGLVASMTMLGRRWNNQRIGALTWLALILALGVSIAANVASAQPTVEARLWAAWPPVGLFVTLKLLTQQIHVRGGAGVQPSAPHAKQPNTNVDGGEHEQDRVTKP